MRKTSKLLAKRTWDEGDLEAYYRTNPRKYKQMAPLREEVQKAKLRAIEKLKQLKREGLIDSVKREGLVDSDSDSDIPDIKGDGEGGKEKENKASTEGEQPSTESKADIKERETRCNGEQKKATETRKKETHIKRALSRKIKEAFGNHYGKGNAGSKKRRLEDQPQHVEVEKGEVVEKRVVLGERNVNAGKLDTKKKTKWKNLGKMCLWWN